MLPKEGSRTWVVYASSEAELPQVRSEIDNVFSQMGYRFYPSIEWDAYGFEPPEGYEVLGAWRHPRSPTFAFLLDNPYMARIDPSVQVLVYVAGQTAAISKAEAKLNGLKDHFAVLSRKGKLSLLVEERLGRVRRSRYLGVITIALGVFTGAVNGFSLYLRKLGPPQLRSPVLIRAHEMLVAAVHFSALVLLLLTILVVLVFLLKYGYLLIRGL